jgi:hypothetical protein
MMIAFNASAHADRSSNQSPIDREAAGQLPSMIRALGVIPFRQEQRKRAPASYQCLNPVPCLLPVPLTLRVLPTKILVAS